MPLLDVSFSVSIGVGWRNHNLVRVELHLVASSLEAPHASMDPVQLFLAMMLFDVRRSVPKLITLPFEARLT